MAAKVVVFLNFILGFALFDSNEANTCNRLLLFKKEANSFLASKPTPAPGECCDESYCESNMATCTSEIWRDYIRDTCDACLPGFVKDAQFGGWPCHHSSECVDINECLSTPTPCQNGGECQNSDGDYSCNCTNGYYGKNCELHACTSTPCKNNATCHGKGPTFSCKCTEGFYGVMCDTDVCKPTPADVVFLLDSSISMTERQFRKQLDFIANFTDHVIIGPDDFQTSVVTFSFDARIEFYLNQFTDNTTLKDAVKNITYRPVATYTDKALAQLPDIFSKKHGGERLINNTRPKRFVFLMTDGMSTDRRKTATVAQNIKHTYGYGLSIAVIGIGNEVSHQELLEVASETSLVYSVRDFDSLYTVLQNLVHYTCDKCRHSSATDAVLLVDASNTMTPGHVQAVHRTMSAFVDDIENELHDNKTLISLAKFGADIQPLFGFESFSGHFTLDDVHRILNKDIRIDDTSPANTADIVNVFKYIDSQAFSDTIKKLAIIFTNGKFKITNHTEFRNIKDELIRKKFKTVAVGSGRGTDIDTLLQLVEDEFDAYTEISESKTVNQVLRAYFTYTVCELDQQ